ncbi:MAG TPA: Ku protein [Caulifigura sp.]|nr:Ku protein [Caulifigura sp.]
MARPIWKGHVSFGLVNVPITLFGAEERTDISFHLLDSRDSARVHYERVNEATGEEVPWDKIVKGYEFKDGDYVIMSDEELDRAQPELTKNIEIEKFVEVTEIEPTYFEKPYYLVPGKGGEKGYVLLREAMKKTGRVGVCRVVIRARGHLAILMPQGNALVLELLRFQQELRDPKDLDLPTGNKGKHHITPRELELATSLVKGMAGEWDPADYEDEYRAALMNLIHKRIKAGQTEMSPEAEEEEVEEEAPTVNFIEVLRKSVKDQPSTRRRLPRRAKQPRKTSVHRKTKKKKAS